MEIATWVKPALWGVVFGAILIMLLGFKLWGWTFAGTAEKMAQESADTAVVAALVPICVSKGRTATVADINEVRVADSWKAGQVVEKKRWSIFPGNDQLATGVPNKIASKCAEELLAPEQK